MLKWLLGPKSRIKTTAIVWLTHFEDAEILAAFDRLCREAGQRFPVYGVYNSGLSPLQSADSRIKSISHDDLKRALPSRSEGLLPTGDIRSGYADAVHIAAFSSVPAHDYYWFIEYDVDFSGDWLSFFGHFSDNQSDLIATTVYQRSADPGWAHWDTFGPPIFLRSEESIRGFFPIYRASRKFIDTYRQRVEDGWTGHFEALFPTIAFQNELTIEDIGGTGPFTPIDRRKKFYWNTHSDRDLSPGSFRFRPAVSNAYFGADVSDYPEADRLWHPIKTNTKQPRRIRHEAESYGVLESPSASLRQPIDEQPGPAANRITTKFRTNVAEFVKRSAHAENLLRLRVPSDLNRGRYLDIGCGTGNAVVSASLAGFRESVGVDINLKEFGWFDPKEFPSICNELGASNARIIQADIFDLDLPLRSFDCVTMIDGIEHVPDPERFINRGAELVADDGIFIVDSGALFHSKVGHHLWQWFPGESMPWTHLRHDFGDLVAETDIDAWSLRQYEKLNKVTHDMIRDAFLRSGLEIIEERRGAPSEADLVFLNQYRPNLNLAGIDERWLFEDWILIVGRRA